jgi:hypothetical protein
MHASTIVQLTDVLAELYPLQQDQLRLARAIGIRTGGISFAASPLNVWDAIIRAALIAVPPAVDALIARALDENPGHPALVLASTGELIAARGPTMVWQPQQLEVLIGGNDLVPSAFLTVGAQRARAVMWIQKPNLEKGTGFLLGGDLLVTNHHVFPDLATARGATILAGNELTDSGLAPNTEQLVCAADGFATSKDDDWTAVRIEGAPSARWGFVPIEVETVKVGAPVNIIQHPLGLPKQVAFRNNPVQYVGGGRVQYLTDTEPGSSGAPVFDDRWRLVAVHHSGGRVREDRTSEHYYRNEGIAAAVVLAGIRAAGLLGDA